jgi:hypothetical protein
MPGFMESRSMCRLRQIAEKLSGVNLAPLAQVAVCLALSFPVAAVHADGDTPTPAATPPAQPEQIVRWIEELDDNRFDAREKAQQQLDNAGAIALEQVAETALTGSLESSTRALNILLSWSEAKDHALRIAALERIVKLPQRPTEAELAGEILSDAREEAALAKIVELGGLHTGDSQAGVFVTTKSGRTVGPVQVILGAHWKGGIDGLDELKKVRRATTLSLHSSPLGDDAIPKLLELSQLRRIELYGSKLTSDGVAELREKLPPETILAVRSGARLGIQGLQATGMAQVDRVIEGSAAEKAGLLPGDVITEFEGEKIDSFTALTDRIATHQPGDSVELKINRPDQTRTKVEEKVIKVTFDQWGIDELKAPTFVQPLDRQIPGQVLPPNTIRIERR